MNIYYIQAAASGMREYRQEEGRALVTGCFVHPRPIRTPPEREFSEKHLNHHLSLFFLPAHLVRNTVTFQVSGSDSEAVQRVDGVVLQLRGETGREEVRTGRETTRAGARPPGGWCYQEAFPGSSGPTLPSGGGCRVPVGQGWVLNRPPCPSAACHPHPDFMGTDRGSHSVSE